MSVARVSSLALTAESADVDMTMIGVSLSASVASGVLLSDVSDGQVVTQHVSHCNCTHRVAITPERRCYRHVIVQPVDGPPEWRRTDDNQLASLVHRPHLVHWLCY